MFFSRTGEVVWPKGINHYDTTLGVITDISHNYCSG